MPASSTPASPNHIFGGQNNGPSVLGDASLVRSMVLIGMDATKDPSEHCLFWALKNLIKPGDSVTVLGILHRISTPMGYKSQANLSDFVGTNKAALEAEMTQKLLSFEDKLRVLADLCDNRGVYLDITITAGTPLKSILVKEATKMKATHVLLDRYLRRDKKYYKEQLQCNVVAFSEKNQAEHVRDSSISYVFDNPGLPFARLNSYSSTDPSSRSSTATSFSCDGSSVPYSDISIPKGELRVPPPSATRQKEVMASIPHSDVVSNQNQYSQDLGDLSPESDAGSCVSNSGESSFIDLLLISPDGQDMPIWSSANENEASPSRRESSSNQAGANVEVKSSTENLMPSSSVNAATQAANAEDAIPSTSYFPDSHRPSECSQNQVTSQQPRRHLPQLNDLIKAHEYQFGSDSWKQGTDSRLVHSQVQVSIKEVLQTGNLVPDVVDDIGKKQTSAKPMEATEDVLVRHLSQAPPLCSVCKLTSMELGRAPRDYNWLELEAATNYFAAENLIAEGGFSFVYRGTLPEGQIVAIKKLKTTTFQNDVQFRTEVEALSCAQHRNVVRLLGYSVGGSNDRALVYEYVCNGTLDQHLSGKNGGILQFSARYKIALGAARGLRYLHEECRVGCIVHRDMRPNNILITHDFVPMVGDFGLAKTNVNADSAVETQVFGALGFVAPEYVECGYVTSKTDVYSFGVVLLELISGRRAVDLQRPKEEISLVEWARQKLNHHRLHELVDQRVAESLDMVELDMMVKAASLCIKKDPQARPGMSQVLRILEGDFYEFSNEMMQENVPIDSVTKAPYWNQSHEDSPHSAGRLQVLQNSSKRVSTVPRMWRSWVRT